MNLFIEEHIALLVLLAIPAGTVVVMSALGLTLLTIDKVKAGERAKSALVVIAVVASFGAFFYGTAKLHDHFNNGKLIDLFILESGGERRLLIWTEMEDFGGGISTVYANRLKLYDLDSGKLLDQVFLDRRIDWNDYTIYGPFEDGRAWSYSDETGLRLLDLFEAKVVMEEEEILKRLPELGDRIRISSGRSYDSETNAISVTTPDGIIHRILPEELGTTERRVDWLYTERYGGPLRLDGDLAEGNIYTSFSSGGETLAFVTIRGYTLSALRLDGKTGEELGRIDYFD